MSIQRIEDTAKEVSIVLEYVDNEIIDKIPERFLRELNRLAENSNWNIEIDEEKELLEQDISEESKDLIGLIYYSYIANEEEKKQIIKAWNENESEYNQELEEKYNLENVFKKNKEKGLEKYLIEQPKKTSINQILLGFFRRILKKH